MENKAPFSPGDKVVTLITRKYPNRTDYMEDEDIYEVISCTPCFHRSFPSMWKVQTNKHKGLDAGMFKIVSRNENKPLKD